MISELRLMFSLMDRVPDGISPMLQDLEDHIINQGLADMIAAADCITTVSHQDHPTVPVFLLSCMYRDPSVLDILLSCMIGDCTVLDFF